MPIRTLTCSSKIHPAYCVAAGSSGQLESVTHAIKENGFGTFGGPDRTVTMATAALSGAEQRPGIKSGGSPPDCPDRGAYCCEILSGLVTPSTCNAEARPHLHKFQATKLQQTPPMIPRRVSRRPASGPRRINSSWRRGRRRHQCPEVLLRRKFCCIQSGCLNQRWPFVVRTPVRTSQRSRRAEKLANNVPLPMDFTLAFTCGAKIASSIQLGAGCRDQHAVRSRARPDAEKFTVSFEEIDGTIATISDQ